MSDKPGVLHTFRNEIGVNEREQADQEVSFEKQRVAFLERALLVERQRLTEVFKDLEAKRKQLKLAELKLAEGVTRRQSEMFSEHRSGHMEDCLDLPLREVLHAMQDRIMKRTSYFGIQALRSPVDQWIYQEVLFETKPDVVIEIGNYCGASVLALAHICDALGKGRVIGVDLMHDKIPEIVRNHPRVSLVEGDACASFPSVRDLVHDSDRVLIIEDSLHTYAHTLNVLNTYSGLVRPGGYFIVEDGICHHGLDVGPNPGPYEAITSFVEGNHDFEIDRSRESFLITWNPKGYLKRVR